MLASSSMNCGLASTNSAIGISHQTICLGCEILLYQVIDLVGSLIYPDVFRFNGMTARATLDGHVSS